MDFIVIFGIGLVASFFGSFTSGGVSIIALALLSFYGLPALVALGIYRVGVVGFQSGGFINYVKAKKIVWKRILPMIFIGMLAAYLGAKIVLSVDEELLSKVIGFAILLTIPLSFLKPKVGIEKITIGRFREIGGYVGYFLTSIWGSSFVIGTGVFNMINQTYVFGMTLLEVKGTAKIPALLKNFVVLALFAQAGVIQWELGLVFMVGMFIGSFLGTKYAITLGDPLLRKIFLVTVFLLSIKLILGY